MSLPARKDPARTALWWRGVCAHGKGAVGTVTFGIIRGGSALPPVQSWVNVNMRGVR